MAQITWHNEIRRIKDLIPYVANPRQITEKQAKDLKKSLDKFGLADPLVINTDNTIIGGHQRKKILETLMGVAPDFEVDVRVPDRELTIDESRELNVRLNKNVAGWDFDVLANNFELEDLKEWGFEDSDLDLDLWLPEAPEDVEPQIDKAEELRVKWGVESGQLWKLGDHRLICGDCTDKAVVERVMGGEMAQGVVTDPPYGINREGIENDDPEGLRALFDSCLSVMPITDAVIIAFQSPRLFPVWLDALRDAEQKFERALWFYDETDVTFPWRGWLMTSQIALVSSIGKPIWSDGEYHHDCYLVKTAGKQDDSGGHSTAKPLDIVEDLVKHTTGIIYEPFSGSGTTLIACERLNRKCRAVEISPAYVAVAIQRWVDVTGGVPELLADIQADTGDGS